MSDAEDELATAEKVQAAAKAWQAEDAFERNWWAEHDDREAGQ